MSILSSLKKSRQSAKEHNKKEAEKALEEHKQVPYRHVPTHAAIDALAAAPSSWKHDDRPKILEQNRRRSVMATSNLGTKMPGPGGLPRVGSSLSHVTYPSVHANPMRHMPRAYSYNGVPPMPAWGGDRSTTVNYSVPDLALPSIKGKEVERLPMFESGRASSASSKGSPTGSSGDSTSSDDLEMRPSHPRHSTMPTTSSVGMSPLHHTSSGRSVAHRLHPSSRRASDASDRGEPAVLARAAAASSLRGEDRRPPPSYLTRGYSSIPAVSALPPTQLPGALPITEPSATGASSSNSTTSLQSLSVGQQSLSSFNFGGYFSSNPTSAPLSTKSSVSLSTPTTPTATVPEEPNWGEKTPVATPAAPEATPQAPATMASPHLKFSDRRASSRSKVARFTELETIDSRTEQRAPELASQAVTVTLPQEKQQAKAPEEPVPAPVPANVGRRLSKQQPAGGKLPKKSRWSMRGSAVAV
ncbi:hypothetical protein BN1723_006279 [Verticillium longisporum]|uniref:Uncharacterized protein n=1 Tax=Verticillium longisporum TaxID=100787 RepID=A0A0G4NE91_VERLO|nr:hypothetical protein BN1723_006279 [Verticillium longisporum]